jgi:hypothetical protein
MYANEISWMRARAVGKRLLATATCDERTIHNLVEYASELEAMASELEAAAVGPAAHTAPSNRPLAAQG